MSKLKPTLDDVLKNPKLLDSMTLGDMLAAIGMEVEVEAEGATPEENARFSRLLNTSGYIPKRKVQ